MKLTHLSLFSGIGGLDIAAEWAGFETVGQCEWADFQTSKLEEHFPNVPKWRDIHELSADDFFRRSKIERGGVSVISGGFPCQPHSLAGKRKASDDERDLWGEYVRVVWEIEPRWVVGENVPGLLSSENGRFFGRILNDLAELGYHVGWIRFPAHAAGAPFWGERVAIVATSDSVRRLCMDENIEARPDVNYMESVAKWQARQTDILSSMAKPNALPKCRHHRNDDGLSRAVDRMTALGNSVVPYQFYPIFKVIADIETQIGMVM